MRTLARWEKKGKWEALRSVRAAPTAVWSCARDGPDERMVCDDRPIERRERERACMSVLALGLTLLIPDSCCCLGFGFPIK